tara:strand:- start:191 stop:511 length:321 start_codon:yes stop_codon:yes gene_type:complete
MKNLNSFMKILLPFTPHLANECLTKLDDKQETWPVVDKKFEVSQMINFVVQINGKTREVMELRKDLTEKEAIEISKKNDKIKKNLSGKNIIRTIFVRNKIINYLIK